MPRTFSAVLPSPGRILQRARARRKHGAGEAADRGDLLQIGPVDRRLAYKNVRTGLIAGAIIAIVFAASFFTGLVY
jgi:hypothetical protein